MTDLAQILSREQVAAYAAEQRAAGRSIILANGCFDLIHVGHIRYLTAAKELGGCLIVAINDDEQVAMQKGRGRPFMPASERAEIIAALRPVDAVTVFAEPTVTELMLAVRPDIHAKGTDYTADSVPEKAVIESIGGRVAIVGDPKDHSSTQLIADVRSR